MGVYCLDMVTPGTYLHNTMDKTDIVHALHQYVELEAPRSLYSSPGYNNNISQ